VSKILTAILVTALLVGPVVAQDRGQVMRRSLELRQAGDLSGAEKQLQDYFTDHPDDVRIALPLGDMIARRGDPEAAIAVWTKMLEQVTPRPDHYVNVSRRLQRLGHPDLAVEILEDGVQGVGSEDPFTWDLGELYLVTGNHHDAVRLHLQLLQRDPHRLLQLQGLLDVLSMQEAASPGAHKRLVDYTQSLRHALKTSSQPISQLLLAHALLLTGQPGSGYQILEKLTMVQPAPQAETIASALTRFAERCEQLGHTGFTTRTYDLLSRVSGDGTFTETSLQRQATLQSRRGNESVAISLYRQLITVAARRPDAAQRKSDVAAYELELARLSLLAGEATESRQILDRLTSTGILQEPQQVQALHLLVESLWSLDESESVRPKLEEMAALPGGVGIAALGLTEWAVLYGDLEMARQQADSLTSQHPESPQANDALQWLSLLDEYLDSPTALQQFAEARLRTRQGHDEEATRLRQQLHGDGHAGLAHQLRLEGAQRTQLTAPAAALGLYEEILEDEQAPDRLRFAATVASARLQADTGDMDGAIQRLEALLLQWPDDTRVPIALDELQQLKQR
jgi:tetratricopeptide (TPR) repeat protein